MALFNAYGNTVPANVVSENNTLNFGLEFEVTESDCELAGYRFYNPVGGATAKQGRLYDVVSQTVIDGPVTFPTDQGRVEVMLGSGVPLAVGTRYKIQAWLPVTQLQYGFTAGIHSSEIINGPLHVFSDAQSTQGQASFNSNGFASYAGSDGNGTGYFIEPIIFQPDPPPPGAVMANPPSSTDMKRVVERIAIPSPWPDDVTQPEPAAGSGLVVRSPAVSGGATAGGLVTQPQGNESVSGAGASTADPVAGTSVATTGAIATAGLYLVAVRIAHTAGTPVAADDLNYSLRVNTTAKATLLVPRSLGVVNAYDQIYLRVTAGQTINIAAIGTGTAATRASASIIATKVAD